MSLKRILICVILICSTGKVVTAQFNYFPFFNPDSTYVKQLSEDCSKMVTNSFVVPEGVSSAYKKDYKERQESMTEYVKNLIKYTATKDEVVYPFVQSVFNKIADANPQLKKYTVVVSKWPVMNAVNVGGNVVIVYMPLLSRMQNESQVATILCHEFAHGELDHMQKGLKKRMDQFYDKQFQKELKKTVKEEFNVIDKVNLLALKYTLTAYYHNRSQEKAADSLGYLFLSKTKFNSNEAVAALDNLKHTDEAPYNDSIDYQKFFKCPTSTFDFKKLKPYKPSNIFSISAEELAKEDSLKDSLRTHPDCDKRMAYIRDLMKSKAPATGSPLDSAAFKKVQWACAMEMIVSFYYYEYYDQSLFNALLYLQNNPDNEFLKSMVLLSWTKLYECMKNHELSDYISNSAEDNPNQLNKLIDLLNTLRLTEMSEFGNCFYQANKDAFKQPEYTLAVNYSYSKMMEDAGMNSWKEKYSAQYKTGRFVDLFELEADKKKKKKK